jgi:hypothetical protein
MPAPVEFAGTTVRLFVPESVAEEAGDEPTPDTSAVKNTILESTKLEV